jgi:hypothetical protein
LAKSCQSISDFFTKEHAVSLNIVLECDLGPWTKADRDVRIVWTRKSSSPRRLEFGRNQCLRYLSGTICDRMQAVIAHGYAPIIRHPANNEPLPIYLVAIPSKKAAGVPRRVGRNPRCWHRASRAHQIELETCSPPIEYALGEYAQRGTAIYRHCCRLIDLSIAQWPACHKFTERTIARCSFKSASQSSPSCYMPTAAIAYGRRTVHFA